MTGADETFLKNIEVQPKIAIMQTWNYTPLGHCLSLIESLFLCTVVGGIGYLYFFN